MAIWPRPWFELKVLAVGAFVIWERMGLARGMDKNPKAQAHNFTLSGSKDVGVQITSLNWRRFA